VLIASRTIDAAPLPEPALPARNRIPAITGRRRPGADRGRQRRQALAQDLLAGDLGVPEAGTLLGMPVHRAQQRIDVDERLGFDPGQQLGPSGQVHQMRPSHRGHLRTVPVRELAQELPQRRRCVHLLEQAGHPAGADHLQIIDAVRARGHPSDDRPQLPRRVHPRRRHLRLTQRDPLLHQLRQPGLLGQLHNRNQAGIRHQMLVVEQRRGLGPGVR
jgi:hypothetical protein